MQRCDSQINIRLPKKEHKAYSNTVSNMSKDVREHIKNTIGDNCENKE